MTDALSDAWGSSSTKPLSVQNFISALPREKIDFVFDRKVLSNWKYEGSKESQGLFNDCLEFISLIDAEGPKALDDVLELMPDEHAVIIAFLCYLRGDVDDLCTRLLAHVDNRDGFFMFCEFIEGEIAGQHEGAPIPIHDMLKHYGVNMSFSSLASAFVNYKMSQTPPDGVNFEDHMHAALRMADQYGLTQKGLLDFNLNCPIPPGLIEVHRIGMANLRNLFASDAKRSQEIIEDMNFFKDVQHLKCSVSDCPEKLDFFRNILAIIAEAYGIYTTPTVSDFVDVHTNLARLTISFSHNGNGLKCLHSQFLVNIALPWNPLGFFENATAHEFCHYLEEIGHYLHNILTCSQTLVQI